MYLVFLTTIFRCLCKLINSVFIVSSYVMETAEISNLLGQLAQQQADHSNSLNMIKEFLNKQAAKRPSNEEIITLKRFKKSECPSLSSKVHTAASQDPTLPSGSGGFAKEQNAPGETVSCSVPPTSPSHTESLADPGDSSDVEFEDDNLDQNLENLECLLMEQEEEDTSDSEDFNLPVLGKNDNKNWSPHPKVLNWLNNVIDRHLPDSILKEINDKFTPPDDIAHFFSPAKLPDSIWRSIKDNSFNAQKQKFLYNLQSSVLNSIKPILSVLPKIQDPNIKKDLSNSVQMICSANLDFNRFRRLLADPHLKQEFRKPLLKFPITHSSLFGEEDFDKSSEKVIKEVASSSKVIKPKSSRTFFNKENSNSNFRGSRGKPGVRGTPFRNRGRGGHRGRGKWNASGNQSYSNQPSKPQSNPASQQ